MQVKSHETHAQANSKLLQVFRYLQALHQARNPVQREINDQPWVMWFHDFPDHPCIRRGIVAGTNDDTHADETKQEAGTSKDAFSTGEDFILKVSRPKLTEPPDPPREITSWLLNGWQHVDGKVEVRSTITSSNGISARTVKFDDDPQRRQLLNEWTVRRNKWAETERPTRRVMDIFDRLYALQTQIERETERLELVIGDGLLIWHPNNTTHIHHPVFLLRLQLQFNPAIPEFTLIEAGFPPELYTALFRSIPDINPTAIGRSREDLEQGDWHPLGGLETDHFLKRLVTQLSPHGEFVETFTPQKDKKIPLIYRDPVLFLRPRTLGFNTALESILRDLPDREDLSHSLTSVVGIDSRPTASQVQGIHTSTAYSPNGEDEHVLLSKPANMEQVEIARRLERQGAVLVQGPPGTGKTHTIANLLGHLLAQGKSVLVTSHTAKALKVLRDQVVEPLQPLCVSVLDDSNSKKQMENTVDAISERLASANVDALEREAATFTRERGDLLGQLREARQRLSEARYDEYRPVVWAGREYPPSQAARFIQEKRNTAAWIPAPVKLGEPLPLSIGELVELYRTNEAVSLKDEREMVLYLPEPSKLITPLDFEQLVAERARLSQENLHYRRDLWHEVPKNHAQISLQELQSRLIQAIEPLRDQMRWRLAALAAGREGGPHRQVWDDLLAEIEGTYALASQAQPLLLKYDPFIPEGCLPNRLEKALQEILSSLQSGGKLNGFTLFIHKDGRLL